MPADVGATVTSVTEPTPTDSSTGLAAGVAAAGGRAYERVDDLLSRRGPAFRRLILANSASTAGDTLVAIALAGTLFFAVPSAEARANVALYLAITLAPFALLAPSLGAILARFPVAYRYGLVASGASRVLVALLLTREIDTLLLFPLAFGLLVFSRLFAISKASLLPVALEEPTSLVTANARLAKYGVAAGALVVPFGAATEAWIGSWATLLLAAGTYAASTWWSSQLPPPPLDQLPEERITPAELIRGSHLPAHIRIAQLATAGVRLLNGFLLLLLAFVLHEARAGLLDFGTILAAGGAGFFLAALVSPWLESRLREEPMVVAALALEAAAALIAALVFGLGAAAMLAATAGIAWGTAKFAFDGMLQGAIPTEGRGIAFTRSETVFALAWVVGALVPTVVPMPPSFGLAIAAIAALAAQVIYVAALLVPDDEPGAANDGDGSPATGPDRIEQTSLLDEPALTADPVAGPADDASDGSVDDPA